MSTPSINTPSIDNQRPDIQMTPNDPIIGKAPGFIKSVLGIVDQIRYGNDRAEIESQAQEKLQDQPEGTAVVVTVNVTKYGNNEYSVTRYDSMSVSEPMTAQQAVDQVQADQIYRDPSDQSYQYIIYKGTEDTCPAVSIEANGPSVHMQPLSDL